MGLFPSSEDAQKKMSLALSAHAVHWQLCADDGPAQSVDTQKPPTAAATKPRLVQLQPLGRRRETKFVLHKSVMSFAECAVARTSFQTPDRANNDSNVSSTVVPKSLLRLSCMFVDVTGTAFKFDIRVAGKAVFGRSGDASKAAWPYASNSESWSSKVLCGDMSLCEGKHLLWKISLMTTKARRLRSLLAFVLF